MDDRSHKPKRSRGQTEYLSPFVLPRDQYRRNYAENDYASLSDNFKKARLRNTGDNSKNNRIRPHGGFLRRNY